MGYPSKDTAADDDGALVVVVVVMWSPLPLESVGLPLSVMVSIAHLGASYQLSTSLVHSTLVHCRSGWSRRTAALHKCPIQGHMSCLSLCTMS